MNNIVKLSCCRKSRDRYVQYSKPLLLGSCTIESHVFCCKFKDFLANFLACHQSSHRWSFFIEQPFCYSMKLRIRLPDLLIKISSANQLYCLYDSVFLWHKCSVVFSCLLQVLIMVSFHRSTKNKPLSCSREHARLHWSAIYTRTSPCNILHPYVQCGCGWTR